MRVCILTSDQPRHRYMVNAIASKFNVVAVFSQAKSPKRQPDTRSILYNMEGKEEIIRYVEEFRETERRYLFPYGREFRLPRDVPLYSIEPDEMNASETVAKIAFLKADCFAVFGTGLIKRELLGLTPNFINIHLGLSPNYRGHACSFWPFYNDEPQYVGVTVFFIDEGIDSGPIIHQSLVDLEPGDVIHDASLKAIRAGIDLQIKALEELANDTIIGHPQDLSKGRTHYAKDFNVNVLREIQTRWDNGRLRQYVSMQERLKTQIRYIA
ncbi:formyl transferase [Nitrospiraceae bacterium AH_259_D15_M11_P09]|nr:formyl transferase [Nitrospiraceae bacterium AH_259_D15_M11_P09]